MADKSHSDSDNSTSTSVADGCQERDRWLPRIIDEPVSLNTLRVFNIYNFFI